MKLSTRAWVGAALALVFSSTVAVAQQTSPPAKQQASAAAQSQKAKAPAKTAKVWTDDDITSLRTPADVYAEQQAQAQAQARAQAEAAAKQKQGANPSTKPTGAHDRLSNPKTAQDADGMIAWEQRDLDAQQEYVKELQDRIDKAPPDQQAKLRQVLQNRIEVVQRIQRDKKALEDQKQQLEKKTAGQGAGSSGQSQQ